MGIEGPSVGGGQSQQCEMDALVVPRPSVD